MDMGPAPRLPPTRHPDADPASVSSPGHGVPSTTSPSGLRLLPAVTAMGLAPVGFSLLGPALLLLRIHPQKTPVTSVFRLLMFPRFKARCFQ